MDSIGANQLQVDIELFNFSRRLSIAKPTIAPNSVFLLDFLPKTTEYERDLVSAKKRYSTAIIRQQCSHQCNFCRLKIIVPLA